MPSFLPLHSPFVTALRRTETVESLLVEVETSAGVIGVGESPQVWQVTGESVASAMACVDQMLAPVVVGRSIADWPCLSDEVQRVVARNFGAKAAVETALCDLAAQAAGVTLADLLSGAVVSGLPSGPGPDTRGVGVSEVSGGRNREVATDVTVSAAPPGEMAASALARLAAGFTHFKLKVGADPALDLARIAAVRDAVGPCPIRVDANQAWSRNNAVIAITTFYDAGLDLEFVEQPVRDDDVEGLAWVRARVPIPIVADESVYTLRDLDRVIDLDAADGVNVKLAKCGGPRQAVAILRRVREAGLETMVGSMMEGPVGVAAAANVALAGGTTLVNDLDAAWWLAEPACGGRLRYQSGRVILGP